MAKSPGCRSFTSNAILSNIRSRMNTNEDCEDLQERKEILAEAAALTKSLYRLCLRSARLVKQANERDEQEFAAREAKEREPRHFDPKLAFLSMLPPVDRPAELRSRYEYYCQYTRETFAAESDIFQYKEITFDLHDFKYFYQYLLKGERDRQWLLKDMHFADPYKGKFDQTRANQLRDRAAAFFEKLEKKKKQPVGPSGQELYDDDVDFRDMEGDYEWDDDDNDNDNDEEHFKE